MKLFKVWGAENDLMTKGLSGPVIEAHLQRLGCTSAEGRAQRPESTSSCIEAARAGSAQNRFIQHCWVEDDLLWFQTRSEALARLFQFMYVFVE